jgi:hypothetical protein
MWWIVNRNDVVLLLGLEIGATPMISIIKDIINNMKRQDGDLESDARLHVVDDVLDNGHGRHTDPEAEQQHDVVLLVVLRQCAIWSIEFPAAVVSCWCSICLPFLEVFFSRP